MLARLKTSGRALWFRGSAVTSHQTKLLMTVTWKQELALPAAPSPCGLRSGGCVARQVTRSQTTHRRERLDNRVAAYTTANAPGIDLKPLLGTIG